MPRYPRGAGSWVLPYPATPAPRSSCHRREREYRHDRLGPEPAARPIDGARPQRRRLAGPRQPERDHAVADRGAGFGMTAGADDDILLALPEIGHGIGD